MLHLWRGVGASCFVVERFVKNVELVVAMKCFFQRYFSLNCHDPILTEKTICHWVSNFRQTLSALNRKSGHPRTAQKNVTAVADIIEQSFRSSIQKHCLAHVHLVVQMVGLHRSH